MHSLSSEVPTAVKHVTGFVQQLMVCFPLTLDIDSCSINPGSQPLPYSPLPFPHPFTFHWDYHIVHITRFRARHGVRLCAAAAAAEPPSLVFICFLNLLIP